MKLLSHFLERFKTRVCAIAYDENATRLFENEDTLYNKTEMLRLKMKEMLLSKVSTVKDLEDYSEPLDTSRGIDSYIGKPHPKRTTPAHRGIKPHKGYTGTN